MSILLYINDNLLWDLLILLACYLYVTITIVIPLTLKKKDKISKFAARKTVHLLSGLVVLIVPFFSFPWGRLWAIAIAGSLTLVVYKSEKGSSIQLLDDLYQAIGEEAEEKLNRAYLQGPFHYCVSITLLVALFAVSGLFYENQIYLPIAGILIMIISDTLASIVGKKYGKHRIHIPWTGTDRSLEGSTTFFITAFLLSFISFFLFGTLLENQTPIELPLVIIYSLITAIVSTIVELLSPSTWDDLTVPIISTLIMWMTLFFI